MTTLIVPIKKEWPKDFYLIYSPEREDPGNKDFALHQIPKVVGGMTKQCLEVGLMFYSKILDSVVPVSSTRVAEMTKLLENIHRSVNIGLVNEMKIISASIIFLGVYLVSVSPLKEQKE